MVVDKLLKLTSITNPFHHRMHDWCITRHNHFTFSAVFSDLF